MRAGASIRAIPKNPFIGIISNNNTVSPTPLPNSTKSIVVNKPSIIIDFFEFAGIK